MHLLIKNIKINSKNVFKSWILHVTIIGLIMTIATSSVNDKLDFYQLLFKMNIVLFFMSLWITAVSMNERSLRFIWHVLFRRDVGRKSYILSIHIVAVMMPLIFHVLFLPVVIYLANDIVGVVPFKFCILNIIYSIIGIMLSNSFYHLVFSFLKSAYLSCTIWITMFLFNLSVGFIYTKFVLTIYEFITLDVFINMPVELFFSRVIFLFLAIGIIIFSEKKLSVERF